MRFLNIAVLCFIFLLSLPAFSAPEDAAFFKDKTKLNNPFSLRDPFRQPLRPKKQDTKTKAEEGLFSNAPTLDNVAVQDLKIIGVFVGKERRAIAKVSDKKDTYILREGMKIGNEGAELKAILPGGVVLVEKIVNVYGQEEYLETIIPLSLD